MEIRAPKVCSLRQGNDAEIYEVLQGSKEVWGSGISLEDYVEYHSLIRNHPWSQEHYKHLILIDEDRHILSSCKTYDYQVRIDSEILRLCGIGAIFTPKRDRGLGYASQMLDYLLDELREQGFDLAMLFSDIGIDFYARLGFRLFDKKDPVYVFLGTGIEPAEIQILNHLPGELLEWDKNYDQRERFAIEKSPVYLQLLSERISWHQQYLGYQDQRVVVSFPERSYLLADLGRWRMTIRRFGTLSPEPAESLGRLLSALYHKLGVQEISGWLPKEFELYPFLRVKEKQRRIRTQMMFLALSEKGKIIYGLSPEEIQFWLADYF
jgi:GNAT superfamily N-acetyltransferase